VEIKNKLGLRLIGLVVLSLLLAVNCAEKGTDPDANIPPDTFVSGFQVELAPDSATYYIATIYWRGSDMDGAVYWYYWSIIDGTDSMYTYAIDYDDDGDSIGIDTTNISAWQVTSDLSVELWLNFPTFDKAYTFKVMAQDNDREKDATPAVESIAVNRIRDFNYTPDTRISTGPPDGALTGTGVHFVVEGLDVDGVVDTIEYKVDGNDWVGVATDINTGILIYDIRGLSVGAHSIAFRAVDNFRSTDPSPISRSVVVTDTLYPELTLSVSDGQSFIVPFTEPTIDSFTVDFTAITAFYYSAIDSYVVASSEGDPVTTTNPQIVFENLGAGDYWIDVTAYDIGGNATNSDTAHFSIVELAANNGLLCVNGVDWGSYGQAVPMWDDGVPWGNRTHFKCWDLFDTTPLGSVPDMADSLLGYGSIPEWMFDTTFFAAISWFGNNYSGDKPFWDEREDAIMAYLEMGGNLLLPARYGSTWFFDELTEYCSIVPDSWTSPGADILTAKVDSLTNITAETAQSLWEVPTTSSANNVWLYEAATAAPGGHAGFIVLPNGPGGGGAFCYIAGRSYRWENADLKANVDVIFRYYFGIEE